MPPERLLKATLLMAFHSIRSERLFCEQVDYNLLLPCFLDMDMVEESFDHSTFSQNRKRLLEHDVAAKFLGEVVKAAKEGKPMSDDHFTVDGTLIEAWASLKSFRPKDEKPSDRPPPDDPGNPTVNFHGQKRRNDTHESTTDPESKLSCKSKAHEATLSYCGNVLMENRNGLIVDLRIEPPTGRAEREGGLALLDEHLAEANGATLGAEAGYDTADFVAACRERNVTPHIAQTRDQRRRSAVDRRATRHAGYVVSQRLRKRVEEILRLGEDRRVLSEDKIQRPGPHAARRPPCSHCVQPPPDGQDVARLVGRPRSKPFEKGRQKHIGPGPNPRTGRPGPAKPLLQQPASLAEG